MQPSIESFECFCAEVVLIVAKLSLTSDVLGDRMKGDISMRGDGDHTLRMCVTLSECVSVVFKGLI